MSCEICGELMLPGEPWTSVDITVHPKCADALDNMVENRKKQKEKLNEIINDIKELEQYGPADYEYFNLDEFVKRLEKFRDQEL